LLFADAQAKRGQPEEGLPLLNEALTMVRHSQERYCEAEIYRLKGELLLHDGRGMINDERKTGQEKSSQHAGEAAACFHKAIDVARSQEAKSWELRAAMSLARLWQKQDKKAEAHTLL